MKFTDLSLPQPLLQAVADLGFEEPTPIQAQALPFVLEGRDVTGQAQTGTGKTACFLLGTLKRLLESERPEGGAPRALVIAPTRELAMQIAADAKDLAKHTDIKWALSYGGTNWEAQANDIRAGVDIVVGTPGRLIDYHKRKVLDLSHIEAVVIDEADRMFDMGFIQDLNYLLGRCPPRSQRQTMLFSATLDYRVQRLSRSYMNEPARIEIEHESLVVEDIDQRLYHVSSSEKFELLLGLLGKEDPHRAMIFVNRKVDGERLAWRLNENGQPAVYLSGDLSQKKRTRIIAAMKDGRIPILVATDVASRGIHVDDITHVFNYDVPQDPEDYVHRIGRTARAGRKGVAILLACDNYVYCLPAVEKLIDDKIPVAHADDSDFAEDQSGRFRRGRKPFTGFEQFRKDGDSDDDGGSKKGSSGKKRSRRSSRSRKADSGAAASQKAQKAEAPKKTEAKPAEASKGNGDSTKSESKSSKRRSRRRRSIGDGRGLAPPKVAKPADVAESANA